MSMPIVNTHEALGLRVRAGQRGISLVIVMIFLVILSVLGVSAIQTSTLSSKVARNQLDRTLAFQAAEAALRDAELDLNNKKFDKVTKCTAGGIGCRTSLITSGGSNFGNDTSSNPLANRCNLGLCSTDNPIAGALPFWEERARWTSANDSVVFGTYTEAPPLPVVAQQPRYMIEYFKQGDESIYRITSLGFGASASTTIMLQTAYKAL